VSIFGSIVSKIFGHREAAGAQPGAHPAAASSAPQSAAAPAGQQAPPAASARGTAAQASTAPQQQPPVDVAAVLPDMAAKERRQGAGRTAVVGGHPRRELYRPEPGDARTHAAHHPVPSTGRCAIRAYP
jgi:hypothetical protein